MSPSSISASVTGERRQNAHRALAAANEEQPRLARRGDQRRGLERARREVDRAQQAHPARLAHGGVLRGQRLQSRRELPPRPAHALEERRTPHLRQRPPRGRRAHGIASERAAVHPR
jgi:hypothetical protein